jgi:hypothetical protein
MTALSEQFAFVNHCICLYTTPRYAIVMLDRAERRVPRITAAYS